MPRGMWVQSPTDRSIEIEAAKTAKLESEFQFSARSLPKSYFYRRQLGPSR